MKNKLRQSFVSLRRREGRKPGFRPHLHFLLLAVFCSRSGLENTQSKTNEEGLFNYQISTVNNQNIALSNDYWLPLIERVHQVTNSKSSNLDTLNFLRTDFFFKYF